MDLQLFMRVLWRFRMLVALGLVLGLALALLSMVRVSFEDGAPKTTYRQPKLWAASTTILVTQNGFPWGRSVLEGSLRVEDASEPVHRFADPNRFTGLASLYSRLADGDEVRRLVVGRRPVAATYTAAPVAGLDGSMLPMFSITGIADSPGGARRISRRATDVFRGYIARQQDAERIPEEVRVRLDVVEGPSEAVVYKARSLTRPIFVLLLVAILTIVLAFAFENARPRLRPLASDEQEQSRAEARRSA